MTRWHWPTLVFKERSLQQLLIGSIVRETDAYSFGNTPYHGFLGEAAYRCRHLAGRSRDDAARRGPVIRGINSYRVRSLSCVDVDPINQKQHMSAT